MKHYKLLYEGHAYPIRVRKDGKLARTGCDIWGKTMADVKRIVVLYGAKLIEAKPKINKEKK